MLTEVAYSIVMSLIRAYECLVFYFCIAFHSVIRRYTRHQFKMADIMIDIDEKKRRPQDMKIHNEKFYARLASYRTMGLGESYVEGWWDVGSLEALFYQVFSKNLHEELFNKWHRFLNYCQFELFNMQTEQKSWEVGEKHYDQGNTLFESFLDKTMNYSCGYWKGANNLDEAQQNKMNLIARKLQLRPGMKVLDIGCGWGALCHYLASNYDVQVVGCTISVEGAKAAQERCRGLKVDIRATDYREIDEKFDRIVSVGMFEHVGHRNYRTFFEVAHRCLTDDGLFLLHTIGMNHKHVPVIEPWFNTYIFPNGILPYHTQISKYTDGLFVLEDWQNMGHHYHKTLEAWYQKFNQNWHTIKGNYKSPEKFYRMWTFYLGLCSAAFRSRKYQLWQVVLSKNGIDGGYDSPR